MIGPRFVLGMFLLTGAILGFGSGIFSVVHDARDGGGWDHCPHHRDAADPGDAPGK